jgi:hypothetical protein
MRVDAEYNDYILSCSGLDDPGEGSVSVYLPGANSLLLGRVIIVKNLFDSAGAYLYIRDITNKLIDGAAYKQITVLYNAVTFICNGTGWDIIK